MTAFDLLEQLHGHGVIVDTTDGKLRVRPKSALPANLIPAIREHAGELLRLVTEPDTPADPGTDREIRRFWSVAQAWPDGSGWFDPREREALELIREARTPRVRTATWPRRGELYDRPGGGTETFTERSARFMAECGGLPPGATRRGGAA